MSKKIFAFTLFILCSLTLCLFSNVSVKYLSKYIENVNIANLADNDDISVIVKLKYEEIAYNYSQKFTDDLDTNQELIRQKRQAYKKYFTESNNNIIEALKSYKLDFDISNYSPFLFSQFDSYQEFLNNRKSLINLSNNELVEKVYVENIYPVNIESTINPSTSTTNITMADAKEMIKISDTIAYDGTGIKIGMIDEGYPSNTSNFSNGEIVDYNTVPNETFEHTTKVASIIGGTYGIAPEADLYIHSYANNANYNFDDAIEWLLDEGVNVINISLGSDGIYFNPGEYDGNSAYMDYIIWSSNVSIVKSAGNRNGDNPGFDAMVTNPGMGLNTYAVGSIGAEYLISNSSSYMVDESLEGIIMKPTLVAPGERIYIPNTNNSTHGAMSGTSFAAPMVTGVIALLLEEFSRLLEYPEVIMAALINSASYLPSQTTIWDEQAGAGLLNYAAARELLSSEEYTDTVITTSTNINTTVLYKDVVLAANQTAEYTFINMFNHTSSLPSGTVIAPNFTKYNVKVYDSTNTEVSTVQSGSNSNIIIGSITNSGSTTQTYTIKVTFNGTKKGIYDEKLGLTVYQHSHSYSYDYSGYSDTKHKAYCHCGTYALRSHTVSAQLTSRYRPCLQCGYMVDMWNTVVIINPQSIAQLPMTPNGSYMLPNGIIVLVPADLEGYLNDTLQFSIGVYS